MTYDPQDTPQEESHDSEQETPRRHLQDLADSLDDPRKKFRETLLKFIHRIEHAEEDKRQATKDVKDIYEEAEAAGLEKKPLKEIIKLRDMEAPDRDLFTDTFQHYHETLWPYSVLSGEAKHDEAPPRTTTTVG